MTLYESYHNDELRHWLHRTVVDHWLLTMLPVIVVVTALGRLLAPSAPKGVVLGFVVLGLTFGWLSVGVVQNIDAYRGVEPHLEEFKEMSPEEQEEAWD